MFFVAFISALVTDTDAWIARRPIFGRPLYQAAVSAGNELLGSKFTSRLMAAGEEIAPETTLMEMDVVIYTETRDEAGKQKLGAVQEDGRITRLCAWTHEPAFDEFMELLVDEEDLLPGYRVEDGSIRIHSVVPENLLSYGSRQVNGGMGLGNPHGEESEMLYYIHQSVLEGVELEVNPDLEVFW